MTPDEMVPNFATLARLCGNTEVVVPAIDRNANIGPLLVPNPLQEYVLMPDPTTDPLRPRPPRAFRLRWYLGAVPVAVYIEMTADEKCVAQRMDSHIQAMVRAPQVHP